MPCDRVCQNVEQLVRNAKKGKGDARQHVHDMRSIRKTSDVCRCAPQAKSDDGENGDCLGCAKAAPRMSGGEHVAQTDRVTRFGSMVGRSVGQQRAGERRLRRRGIFQIVKLIGGRVPTSGCALRI